MANRPTIADLAAAAGVSTATVDRLLNGRHPVREVTAQRIADAAEAIGFRASGLIGRRLTEAPVRTLGFLLQKRDAFYGHLAEALDAATRNLTSIRGRPVIRNMEELVPAVIAERIAEVGPTVDALAVVAIDHPLVTAAVDAVAAAGTPVYTLLSDLTAAGRAGYFAADSRRSGRTAGWAIARLARRVGKVGVLLGSHRYLSQEMAESSLRGYIRSEAPAYRLLDALINLEDHRVTYEAVGTMIRNNPDLVGIYAAGGGVDGMIAALREEDPDQTIIAVCNELTPATRAALADGTIDLVLDTPVEELAARAVEVMAEAALNGRGEGVVEILLPAELYVAGNI